MANLKRAKPREVIDIRLRLRKAIRATIAEITLVPRGFKDKKYADQLGFKGKGKALYEGIDNKDWRFYRVHLKGCQSLKRGFYPVGVYERLKEIDREQEEKRKGLFTLPKKRESRGSLYRDCQG
jgi:hypothetical protein